MSEKYCEVTGLAFEVSETDKEFLARLSPKLGNQTFQLPEPTLSPNARWQRRMSLRNERNLYRGRSWLSGKDLVSVFSPHSPYKVIEQDEFYGDSWDPLEFGFSPSLEQTFTEQFRKLLLEVPHQSLYTKNVENSYYTNYSLNLKNCYFVIGAGNNEDCLYCRFIHHSTDILDCTSVYNCELCYEGSASQGCYSCCYFDNCRDCNDCYFIRDCESCNHCFMCFGLHRKEYCILNEYLGKAKYEEALAKLLPLERSEIESYWNQLASVEAKCYKRPLHMYGSEDCVGDTVFRSARCYHAFDIDDCEDCRYLHFTPKGRYSMDCTYNAPDGVEYCYETCSTVGSKDCLFTFLSWHNSELLYCIECQESHNCFGCVGLRRKQYCIFNQQYDKDSYFEMTRKLIRLMQRTGEWGEYFSPALSFFGYHETVANEYFPLEESEAKALGFRWTEDERPIVEGEGVRSLPDTIVETVDEITSRPVECSTCSRLFRLTTQEIRSYRKLEVPAPLNCYDCRHRARDKRRNPRNLFHGVSALSGETLITTYPPERQQGVVTEAEFFSQVK